MNTLPDQLLENVRVQLELAPGYNIVKEINCERLPYGEPGSVYIILEFPIDLVDTTGTFGAALKFIVKDCDPTTGLPDSDEGDFSKYSYF